MDVIARARKAYPWLTIPELEQRGIIAALRKAAHAEPDADDAGGPLDFDDDDFALLEDLGGEEERTKRKRRGMLKAGNAEALSRWVGKVGFDEAVAHIATKKDKKGRPFGKERAKKIAGKLKGMANQAGTLASEHSYDPKERAMAKAGLGEGSRGGKVVGHTRSGKPIYASGARTASYSEDDHLDAARLHLQKHEHHDVRAGAFREEGRHGESQRHTALASHHLERLRQHLRAAPSVPRRLAAEREGSAETSKAAGILPLPDHTLGPNPCPRCELFAKASPDQLERCEGCGTLVLLEKAQKPLLGNGTRFAALSGQLARRKGVRCPKCPAASARMAAAGR
jgi:hypothetical protein